jgi:hypothetical protein
MKDKGNRFLYKTDTLIHLKLSALYYESSFYIQFKISVYPRIDRDSSRNDRYFYNCELAGIMNN